MVYVLRWLCFLSFLFPELEILSFLTCLKKQNWLMLCILVFGPEICWVQLEVLLKHICYGKFPEMECSLFSRGCLGHLISINQSVSSIKIYSLVIRNKAWYFDWPFLSSSTALNIVLAFLCCNIFLGLGHPVFFFCELLVLFFFPGWILYLAAMPTKYYVIFLCFFYIVLTHWSNWTEKFV